ncbi:hypothetical protein N0V90_011287 [Kalmusia sp. IMI 367209]|nr:hypothetical protein N0V90_011287 [Kalmusia sp. IMI 367209]
MSFGFSVGDVIAVTKMARSLRKNFIDAPVQFRTISDEVTTLSHILQDLEDGMPERDLPANMLDTLKEHMAVCESLLQETMSNITKYHSLECSGSRKRRVWQRLRWEPDDIKDLRLRLAANVSLLSGINIYILRHTVSDIEVGVERLNQALDEQLFAKFTTWLSDLNMFTHHNDIMTRRLKDTGSWFLQSTTYLHWLDSVNDILYCPGIPGAGKTMMAAAIIEDLRNEFDNDPDVGIAFLYCSYKRQQEQTLGACLAEILMQLLQGLSTPPQYLQTLYGRHRRQKSRPGIDELTIALKSVCISYTKVYLVIDALDEYSKIPSSLTELLEEIVQLQVGHPISFLATSRHNISGVRQIFDGRPRIEIRAQEEDVRKVLDSEMSHMPSCIVRNPALQAIVKHEITKAIDGIVIKALDTLPRGKEALSDAYKEALERIDGQQPGRRDLAKRVLIWVSHAKEPLSTVELQQALAVELDEDGSGIDEDNLIEVEEMISCCEGLVILDEESNMIRLVHYTTQQYLDGLSAQWMQFAEKEIALVCLAYLSFDEFAKGACCNDEAFEERLRIYRLFGYCARNWGDHVRAADDEKVNQTAIQFLNNNLTTKSAVQARMVSSYHFTGYSENFPLKARAVHLCGQFGLSVIMNHLISNGHRPDPCDDFVRTPLSYAAEHGHPSIAILLSLDQTINFESMDNHGRNTLSWAAGSGHVEFVKVLLDRQGISVNSRDNQGMTPLAWAARRNRFHVVQFLLKHEEIEIDVRDEREQTPLSWAAYNGHIDVVKILMSHPGVDICCKDIYSQTPLAWAARNGHAAVASLLADIPGMDADVRDDNGRTPLMWASIQGHLDVVEMLAARNDVCTDAGDDNGQTSLSWAAREGHLDVVKYLMKRKDVDTQSFDKRRFTARRWAAWNGYEAVAKALGQIRRRS